jgi:SAM-dependent methyltransferase
LAKIEINHPAAGPFPAFTEIIEVRVWGMAGIEGRPFYIGGGLNFQGGNMLWLEYIYSVEGAQVFYTRNFVYTARGREEGYPTAEEQLDALAREEEGRFGYGDMLPETGFSLTVKKYAHKGEDGEIYFSNCDLQISADTGAVFGHAAPGERFVDIRLPVIKLEEGVRFMRELVHEIDAAHQGRHLDPAGFPEGSSEWPFIDQLNRLAYNKISTDYQETYFNNPRLAESFDGWLGQLPPGGAVLDAGCGHGDPVINRLLERGYQVTGSDFSPAMLRRAGEQFPQARFIQQAITALDEQAAYDGICSFNALLYLDLIDLLHGIRRLRAALRPGGLLFLYALDSGPDWRGEPLGHRVGQWMWSWHYGMEEAAGLLEEHGCFEVLEKRVVQEDPEDAARVAQELEKQKKEEVVLNLPRRQPAAGLQRPTLVNPGCKTDTFLIPACFNGPGCLSLATGFARQGFAKATNMGTDY